MTRLMARLAPRKSMPFFGTTRPRTYPVLPFFFGTSRKSVSLQIVGTALSWLCFFCSGTRRSSVRSKPSIPQAPISNQRAFRDPTVDAGPEQNRVKGEAGAASKAKTEPGVSASGSSAPAPTAASMPVATATTTTAGDSALPMAAVAEQV
jgi:hypothetical protein